MSKGKVFLVLAVVAVALISTALIKALRFPDAIRSDAERIAAGSPYCLALPGAHRPVTRWLDLTPFVARGNRLRQHLVLYVEAPNGIEGYHWSYGSSKFNPGAIGMQHCLPQRDFLSEMKDERPGFYFVLDGSAYVIPPEFEASHIEEDFISLDFGSKKKRVAGNDYVEIGLAQVERWRRMASDGIPVLGAAGQSLRTEGDYGFSVRDYDTSGQLQQEFRCLYGKNLCVLEFVAPPGLFHVALDETSVELVPQIRQRILDTWQGFQLPL